MINNRFQYCKITKLIVVLIFSFVLFLPSYSFCKQETVGKTLIIYYSNTGNTKAACEALQKKLGADLVEVKDLKNNPGKLTMKPGKKLDLVMDTEIKPKTVDISAYSSIILGSPIWMGTLSPAMKKFVSLNKLTGKKVGIFTTTNASENEKQREKTKTLVEQAGGKVVGYYQVLVMEEKDGVKEERSKEQIAEDALKFIPEIQNTFSSAL